MHRTVGTVGTFPGDDDDDDDDDDDGDDDVDDDISFCSVFFHILKT